MKSNEFLSEGAIEQQHGDTKPWAYWGYPERVAKKLYQIHRGQPIDKSAIVQLWKEDGPDRMTKFMLKPDVAAILSAYEQMSDAGPLFQQGVAEGVAETMSMDDAMKVLRHYGAGHFKTTSNELHFYKNGQPFSIDLTWGADSVRSVSLSQLNAVSRQLKGQGVAESQLNEYLVKAGMPVKDVLTLNLFQDFDPVEGCAAQLPEFAQEPMWKQVVRKYAPIANMLEKKLLAQKRPLTDAEAEAVDQTWYDGSDAYDDCEIEYLVDIYDQQIDTLEALLAGNLTDEEFGEGVAEAEGEPERKQQTKTKSKFNFDPFQKQKDQPIANTDPLDDLKKNAGMNKPEVNIKKASQSDTLKKTAGLGTPEMGDMLSKLRNIEIDPDLDAYPDQEPSTDLSTRVDTQNLPAIAGDALQAAGTANPDFHQVANLPGNISAMIRQLGKTLFGSFTSTPTSDIYVVANLGGKGPNSSQEVNAVANFVQQHGDDRGPGDIDFDRVMPGYKAQVHFYSAAGIRWMLVKDFAGQYIYAWPESDSRDATGAIGNSKQHTPRLK